MDLSNLGIRSECNRYVIRVGEEDSIVLMDAFNNVINPTDYNLRFTINDSRIAGHVRERIKGKAMGNTSVVIEDADGNRLLKIPVQVMPALKSSYWDEFLPFFILGEDREVYDEKEIYSCHELMDYLEEKDLKVYPYDEEENGPGDDQNCDCDEIPDTREHLYAREAALFELPRMDKHFALIAAFAGIRNIYDLSRVNKAKALSVFKIVAPMTHMFDDDDEFEYPSDERIEELIDRAHALRDFSSKYATFVYHDPEPSYLLENGVQKIKTDTDVINEALKFLQNMSISLPLPRTISGKVTMKSKNGAENLMSLEGLKVSVTGIANPASDKSEDDEDLHTYTDNEGKFIIVMPEKYNMQETVKFTVSYDASKDGVSSMTSEEKLTSVKSTTFVKRASEIMKAIQIEYYTWIEDEEKEESEEDDEKTDSLKTDSYLTATKNGKWDYKKIPAIELLEKLDRLQESSSHAKELEDKLYNIALNEYNLKQLTADISRLKAESIACFKEIFDEIAYHVYLKDKEYEEKKALKDRLMFNFNKELGRYLDKEDKTLGNLLKKKKNIPADATEAMIQQMQAEAYEVQHKIDVVKALKVTCKKEDENLFRYMIDNTYDYNLRDEIAEIETPVRRDELVTYFEENKEYSKKLQDFLAQLSAYNERMDALKEEKKFLESLLKLAETIEFPEEEESEAEEEIQSSPEGEDGESGETDKEENKEEKEIGKKPEVDDGGKLRLVEEEHKCGVAAADALTQFKIALQKLYKDSLEDCQIFCDKYDNYKNVETKLAIKEKELEEIKEIKENATKEDFFNTYLLTHAEDEDVKKYHEYKENAKKLYWEIQDMDDTIGTPQMENKADTIGTPQMENKEDTTKTGEDPFSHAQRSYDPDKECNNSSFQSVISSILSKSMDANFADPFELIYEHFIGVGSKPRALPTVRLMGEGKTEIELPTDTAPARVFNYSILQRLVEPVITKKGIQIDREKISKPIDVMNFKEDLYRVDENVPIASSLGIGYILNMHQAWIPDGYALGTLLYSMILAPGEEQRVIVREHTESYTVSDDASAMDMIRDEYANNQIDHETAAFEQAVLRASDASSEASYSTQSTSVSASVSGGWGPIGGSISASHSRSSGRSSASSAQNDSYDDISTAAQDFQTSIKTQSERLASAKRLSIRTASSSEAESLSSKIVANHNHSHVMTVQYWEVTRRYKMETCIEGIDLVLFVPLKPICFLPDLNSEVDKSYYEPFSNAILNVDDFTSFTKKRFEFRYHSFLRYADTLERYLPRKYRGGLELVKKFAAYPMWKPQEEQTDNTVFQLKLVGYFLEYDDISATMHFNKGKETVAGELEASDFLTVHPSMNTRKDVIYALKKLRTGYSVRKDVDQTIQKEFNVWGSTFEVEVESSLDNYITRKITEMPTLIFTFYLPSNLSRDDISHITIENDLRNYSFTLSQDPKYLQDHEIKAIENYEDKKWDFAKDDRSSGKDLRRMAHYREALPECYTRQIQTLSRSELISIGGTKISAYIADGQGFSQQIGSVEWQKKPDDGKAPEGEKPSETAGLPIQVAKFREADEKVPMSSNKLLNKPIRIDASSHVPVLGYEEIMKIEETFRHVTTNTMRYSLAVWNAMSETERTMMLEQFTVDLDYGKISGEHATEGEVKIPLLNCINVKKPLGYYGNSIMFPFTYPQELAEKLGKTAGDIQDELYRFHTTNFRVPSTSISVPTNGMIGEAVLGRTNVSEKIDITRFWNWKDSDIDHMEINQNGLNGHSLLDNADTKWVDAPTQGVTATEHVNGSGLLNSLTSRPQPTFADVLANTDVRGLLQNADNNAAAGREQVVKATSDMTKSAISAASDIAKTVASKASSVSKVVGDKDNITSALKKMGLSDSVASSISEKIASGETSFSDALTSISNAGGKSLGGLSDSGEGGESHVEDPKTPESQSNNNNKSLKEAITFAMDALETGMTPVDMFNKWMKEERNSNVTYTEDDIKTLAERYCASNGTTMDAVITLIDELINEQ